MPHRVLALSALLTALLTGCTTMDTKPLHTVDHVDLERFMGEWYVIASIPTFIERHAHNAVETYRLDADGTVATTFTFNEGSFDGPLKRYEPRGFVRDSESNAVWGMQFIWPIKADYRITYLEDDYFLTAIGRDKRDYAWIMAREPRISDEDYARVVRHLQEQAYDVAKLRKVPHRWPQREGHGSDESGKGVDATS